jgi:hypothetical protein
VASRATALANLPRLEQRLFIDTQAFALRRFRTRGHPTPSSHAIDVIQAARADGMPTRLRLYAIFSAIMIGWVAPTACWAQPAVTLGILTPFYRATQLQGHLFGMGLTTIPDYLLTPGLAFPYRRKAGFAREIPFVDTFSINRVLGGYPEAWLKKFRLLDPVLGRRSLDYVVRGPDGKLQFRTELIRARLKPYLDAGYTQADITLALDNPPWDVATPDGAAPQQGAWGRKTPPGDLGEWAAVLTHLATDLKAILGPAAEQLSFETGVEYDERASFDGTAPAFFQYYAASAHAIHAVLPHASFGPGEFTGLGACPAGNESCVYDTARLLDFARAQGMLPSVVPRSLHALADHPSVMPSQVAARYAASYARLPTVTPEVHQFGLLFEPFGESWGGDIGPTQANWEFQTMFQLLAARVPRRVFHWGGLLRVAKLDILNGSGFLRLVLDHYVGSGMTLLHAVHVGDESNPDTETLGLSLTGTDVPAVVLSSFSVRRREGSREVSFDLPDTWPANHTKWHMVSYRAGHDVFATIRHDLLVDANLRPEFLVCIQCEGSPMLMALDADRARAMLERNWPRYQALIQAGLQWREAGAEVKMSGRRLTVSLGDNELLVVAG